MTQAQTHIPEHNFKWRGDSTALRVAGQAGDGRYKRHDKEWWGAQSKDSAAFGFKQRVPYDTQKYARAAQARE